MNTYNDIQTSLKKELDKERYIHTLGVAYTAASMAMCHKEDGEKAFLAGLLHDSAKCISDSDKLQICKDNNIEISPFEVENPFLLHSKLGAFLAETKYNILDKEILSAITYHTTGKPNMTLFEKIIYIADYIEPNRKALPNMDEIRYESFHNIDKALVLILENTIGYLRHQNRLIDDITLETYNYYSERLKLCQKN